MNGTIDGISVVVPTYGRLPLVRRLLESCGPAMDRYPGDVEIIIVDTSEDPAADGIQQLARDAGASYVRGPQRVGAKRNLGARLARHEVILFIDSDCEASPAVLAEHAACYADPAVSAVIGQTQVRGEQQALWKVLDRSREFGIPYSWPRYLAVLQWGATANFSVRRAAFFSVGGFDEHTWTLLAGEDVDLGVRLVAAGFRIIGSEAALLYHGRDPIGGLGDIVRTLLIRGQADSWLSAKYPGQRELRGNPVLLGTVSLLTGGVLATVSRRAWPAAAGALMIPGVWAATLLMRLPLRGPRPYLEPVALLIDWSFDAGVVLGAVRHRRPWLALFRFRYLDYRYCRLRDGYRQVPAKALTAWGSTDAALRYPDPAPAAGRRPAAPVDRAAPG